MKRIKGTRLVYIAGPYRGDVERNVASAQHVGDKLARAGVAFVCPHSNGQPHDHLGLSDEYWLESTLEIMRRCDAVMLVDGWEGSCGTIGEIKEAQYYEKKIFLPNQIDKCIEFALRK